MTDAITPTEAISATAAPEIAVAGKTETGTIVDSPIKETATSTPTKRVAKRPRIVDWECPICFKTSDESGVIVATLDGCRLSGCLLCMDCATNILVHATAKEQKPRCPQCNATFTEARPLAAFVDQSVEESAAKLAKTIQDKSQVLAKETVAAELKTLHAFIDTCGSLRCSGCNSFCSRLFPTRNIRTKQVREAFEKSRSSGQASTHTVASTPAPVRSEQRRQSILPGDILYSDGHYYERRPELGREHLAAMLTNARNVFAREIRGEMPAASRPQEASDLDAFFVRESMPAASRPQEAPDFTPQEVLDLNANASTSSRHQPVQPNQLAAPIVQPSDPLVRVQTILDDNDADAVVVQPSSRHLPLRPFHEPVSSAQVVLARSPIAAWTAENTTILKKDAATRYLADKIISTYRSRSHRENGTNTAIHSFDIAVPEIDAGRVSLTVAGARGCGMKYNGRLVNDRASLRAGLRRYAEIYLPILERMILVMLNLTMPFRIEVGNQWHPLAENGDTARQVYMHYIIHPIPTSAPRHTPLQIEI